MAGSAGLEGAAAAGQLADAAGTFSHQVEYLSGDSWYFRARRRFLAGLVSRHARPGSLILDAGCGDGKLAASLPRYTWRGIEPDPGLRALALEHGVPVLPGRAKELPFGDGVFDAVCLFDVLEHVEDDRAALCEVRRVLKPGGLLFVSVPLHPELWSEHDVRCGHYRRYRKGEVVRQLEKCGFRPVERRFFVSLFLPLAALSRRLGGSGSGHRLPGALDRLAAAALLADAALGLPFGLSEAGVFLNF